MTFFISHTDFFVFSLFNNETWKEKTNCVVFSLLYCVEKAQNKGLRQICRLKMMSLDVRESILGVITAQVFVSSRTKSILGQHFILHNNRLDFLSLPRCAFLVVAGMLT